MKRSKVRLRFSLVPAAVLFLLANTRGAHAQSRGDCSTSPPPAVGVSLGRSSPYLDLSREVVDASASGSILVHGGGSAAGRLDVPIAGPWRARVEGSLANWRVVRQTYGDGFQSIARETMGHVKARQVFAMFGRQGGRSPLCAYVLAGAGLYSLGYRAATVRRPGVALTTGVEFPVGSRGAIQVDVQLHLIDTGARYPIASSTVMSASISAGWSHRF